MATIPGGSANDLISDEFTTHTINILRVAASLQKPVLAELERLEKSLAAEVAKLPDDPTSNKLARLSALLKQTQASISAAYQKIGDTTQKGLVKVAAIEQQKTAQVVNKGIGASVMTVAATEEQLQAVASGILLTGRFPSQWWAAQDAALKGKFEAAMRDGIARGEGVDKLVQRVRGTKAANFADGLMAVPKYQAEALVRTAVQTASNAARLLSFEKNAGPKGVIKAIQWRSTLDSRTTPICIKLNGLQWALPGYDPIDHDEPFPGPIAHWNCRSTQTAVTKSWAELAKPAAIVDPETGKDTDLETKVRAGAKEDGKTDAETDAIVDKQKDAVDGEASPTETGDEFMQKQSETTQNALLGPQQAEMYRQGKLNLTDAIDQKNRPLSTDALQTMVDNGHSVPVVNFAEGEGGLSLAERSLLNESHTSGVQAGKVLSHFMDGETGQTISFDGTTPSPDDVAAAKKFQSVIYLRNGLEKGAVFGPQEYQLMASLPNFAGAKLVNPSGRVLSVNVKPGQTFTPDHATIVNAKMDALKNTKNMGLATKMGLAVGSKDVPSVSFKDHGVGAIQPPPTPDTVAAKVAQKKAEAQAQEAVAAQKKAEADAAAAKKAQDDAVAAQKKAEKDAAAAKAKADKDAAAAAAEAKKQAAAQKVIDANPPTTPLGKIIDDLIATPDGMTMKPSELLASARATYKAQVEAEKQAKAAAAAAKKKAEDDAREAAEQAEIAKQLAALKEIADAKNSGTPEGTKLANLVYQIQNNDPKATNASALADAKAQIAKEQAEALAKAQAAASAEQAKQDAASKMIAGHLKAGKTMAAALQAVHDPALKPTELLAAAKAKVNADIVAEQAKQAAAQTEIEAHIKAKTPYLADAIGDVMTAAMKPTEILEAAKIKAAADKATADLLAQQAAAAAALAAANKTATATLDAHYKEEAKGTIAAFGPGSPASVAPVNGIPFSVPPTAEPWLLHKDVNLSDEPALPPTNGKAQSTGVIFVEKDGSVWLFSPTNDFGGYKNTWSKGRTEPGLTMQQNALKEAYEELGLTGSITGYLGDFAGSTTMTRFYIGARTGGEPWTTTTGETDYVKLATPDQAKKLFNVKRDRDILEALLTKLNAPAPAPAPLPTAPPVGKAVALTGFPADVTTLRKIKGLGGTTGAYLAEDPATGAQYVVKKGGTSGGDPANHLREEFMTDQMYRSMGVTVPEAKLYDTATGPVKVAKFLADTSSLGEYLANATPAKANAARDALRANFVIDALLGNWDVMGASNDNVRVAKDGTVYRIDNGGGLRYRAQGKQKDASEWNQGPQELWSLRRQEWVPSGKPILPGNRDIFGKLSIMDIAKQIRAIPEATFQKALTESGAPPEVHDMLVKRMAAMRVVADKAFEATKYNLKLPYTEELTRRMVDLRSEGVVDRMSKKLDNPAGNCSNVVDENGKNFDELRGTYAGYTPVTPSTTAPGAPKVIFASTFDTLAAAVKTVQYHAGKGGSGDNKYNPAKIAAALALEPSLTKAAKAKASTPDEKAAAKAYLAALGKLKQAVAVGQGGDIKGAALVIPKIDPVKESSTALPAPAPKPAAAGSITKQVWDFITRQGGDPKIINDWMGSQAGSSWSQEAQAYKYYLTTILDRPDTDYWWKHGKPAAKTAWDTFVVKYTLPAIEKTMQIWHAYNQEILGNTAFRYNDTTLKVVRLIRTEYDTKTMGHYKNSKGQKYYDAGTRRYEKNISFPRGGNESSSIFKDKYPLGSTEVTVQVVPHVRVTGIYFTDRLDRLGDAGFAGNSENEFTFMTAGLPLDYTGHQGATGIDLDGGSDATKWGIDLAHIL